MTCFRSIILFIFLTIFLAACGPIYKTEYAYVPPNSKSGNLCIANCVQQKGMCEQMCEMRKENCRTRALYQFEVYKNEQIRLGNPVFRSLGDFERDCNMIACNCSATYNDCYSACGGEVLERQVCVAFCDKQ